MKKLFMVIALLAVAGIGVSSFSLYHHYQNSQTSFCDIGENFNCDIVNRSVYSTLFGIPVALIGMVGYLGLLVLATIRRDKPETAQWLFGGAVAGLGFALYLTYIEGFVLGTWCILCLSSLGLITLITILGSWVFVLARRGE